MIRILDIAPENYKRYDRFMEEVVQGRYSQIIGGDFLREAGDNVEASVTTVCIIAEEKKSVPVSMKRYKDGRRELAVFTNYASVLEEVLSEITFLSGIKLNAKDVRSGEEVIRLA